MKVSSRLFTACLIIILTLPSLAILMPLDPTVPEPTPDIKDSGISVSGFGVPLSNGYNGQIRHVGGFGPGNYTDIQTAVFDSSDGDQVWVYPGTYSEYVAITSEILIKGGAGARLTSPGGGIGFDLFANNVTITGMNITDFTEGIFGATTGHNFTDNKFFGNTMDIRIFINTVDIDREFDLYGLTIDDNWFEHSTNSRTIDIEINLDFDNVDPHDVDIADVIITNNFLRSAAHGLYQIEYDLSVKDLPGGTLDIGDFIVEGNEMHGGGEDLKFSANIGSLIDVTTNIGDLILKNNQLMKFDDGGFHIDFYQVSNIFGSSPVTIGDIIVEDNYLYSTRSGAEAVYITGWTGWTLFEDTSSLVCGDADITNNIIDVNGYGVYVEMDDIGYGFWDNSYSITGNLHIFDNRILNSTKGIYLYLVDIGMLHGSSSVDLGWILIENNLINSTDVGLDYVMEAIGYDMNDESTADLGRFTMRENQITSKNIGVSIYIDSLGRVMWNRSSLIMEELSIINNSISASVGVNVPSIHSIGHTLFDEASVTFGGLNISGNTILDVDNGIYFNSLSEIGFNLMDSSSLIFGDIVVFDNEVEGLQIGIYLMSMILLAYNLFDDANAEIGGVRFVNNRLTSGSYGIFIGGISRICNELWNVSTASFGGVNIDNNVIASNLEGLFFSSMNEIGVNLWDNTSVVIEDFSFYGNEITSGEYGFYISYIGNIGLNLRNWSSVTIGDIILEDNTIYSNLTGILIVNYMMIGSIVEQRSIFKGGNLIISNNSISALEGGIMISFLGYIGYLLSGDADVRIGSILIEDNTIDSNYSGIRLNSVGYFGFAMYGTSTFNMGDIRLEKNHIIAQQTGIQIDSVQYICYLLFDDSISRFGGISIQWNHVESEGTALLINSIISNLNQIMNRAQGKMGNTTINGNYLMSSQGYGIYYGPASSTGMSIVGDANGELGSFGINENTIISKFTGIYVFLGAFGVALSVNATFTMGPLKIDDNHITSQDRGLDFYTQNFGISNTGNSLFHVVGFSFSGNIFESVNGTRIVMDSIGITDTSRVVFGYVDIIGNMINVSDMDGLNLTLRVTTTTDSYFKMDHIWISQNQFLDIKGTALILRTELSEEDGSVLKVPLTRINENIISGAGVGLELYQVKAGNIFINDFYANLDHVNLVDSNIQWISRTPLWYRHGMTNLSSYLGNYWDSYTGSDNNNDGIGDTPYNTGFGLDTYPLMSLVVEYLPPWNDVIPPEVVITSPENGTALNKSSVEISWVGADDLLGIERYDVKLDDGAWDFVGMDTTYAFSSLSEGYHTLWVRAVDKAGNEGTGWIVVIIDLTDPTLEIMEPSEGEYLNISDVMVSWDAVDKLSGITHSQVKLDNGSWQNALEGTGFLFTNVSEGAHYVEVMSRDIAGNMIIDRNDFWIDLTDPTLNIMYPTDDLFVSSRSIQADWSAFGDISGIGGMWVKMDNGSWIPTVFVSEHMFRNLSLGNHTLWIKVQDGAGNWFVSSVDFEVGDISPILSILSPSQGAYLSNSSVEVKWTVLGTTYAPLSFETRLDGGTWENLSVVHSRMFIDLPDGERRIDVKFSDRGGNTETATVVFIVDTTSPTIVSISHSGDESLPGDPVVIEFSERMMVDAFNILLNEVPITETGELSEDGMILTLSPTLEPGDGYTLFIEGKDLAGNTLLVERTFRTASKGTISGRLVDPDGDPITNARIVLDTGEETSTDSNGDFELRATPGMRTVTIFDSDGNKLHEFEIEIIPGETVNPSEELSVEKHEEDKGSLLWLWILIVVIVLIIGSLIAIFILMRRREEEEDEYEDDDEEYDEDWDEEEVEFGDDWDDEE